MISTDKKILSIGQVEKDETAFRIDIAEETNPDLLYDIRHVPLPFKDTQFVEARCFGVLPYLTQEQAFELIIELCRVAKVVRINAPHVTMPYSTPPRKNGGFLFKDFYQLSHVVSWWPKKWQKKIKINSSRLNLGKWRWLFGWINFSPKLQLWFEQTPIARIIGIRNIELRIEAIP